MPQDTPFKSAPQERQLIRNRAIVAFLLVCLSAGLLVSRMVHLQVLSHDRYATLSQHNRIKVVPIPPLRGRIYDRNGVLLADNMPAYRLEVTPEDAGDLDVLLQELDNLIDIGEEEAERFLRTVRRSKPFAGVPLRHHLDQTEVARIAINRHRLPGVEVVAAPLRHYPLGKHAAHALGYVGRISEQELRRIDEQNYRGTAMIGKVGVEKAYEELLHGKVGFQRVETDAYGRTVDVLHTTAPIPGNNLYLTLDTHLQRAAEQALADRRGAIVALDPHNGDILAMVSTPSYDPNRFVLGLSASEYRALQTASDQPLFNRPLRGQYPPASILKPFVALAGLEYGTAAQHQTFCPGHYSLPGAKRPFRCWKRTGHGWTDLTQAVAQSCDVYFYNLAHFLGIDRMHEFLSHFSFGQRTGVDLPGELPGLLPSREWKRAQRGLPWFPGETVITGIGQGFTLTTPLQLAAATGVLALQGQFPIPRILKAVEDPIDQAWQPKSPEHRQVLEGVTSEHWAQITDAMTATVHGRHGTARAIGVDSDYQIAGKTGTAQVVALRSDDAEEEEGERHERFEDHALFSAFAPADDPRIVVAVIVENGGSGSAVAAPIARQILDAYLRPDSRLAAREE